MNYSIQPNRIAYIDVAKGLSILLVALGHANATFGHGELLPTQLDNFLRLLRIPFFFFLSGLFISTNKPLLNYLTYKFDAFVKPYLSILLITLLVSLLMGTNIKGPLKDAISMLYGSGFHIPFPWVSLWFLPHLWAVYMFSSCCLRLTNYNEKSLIFKITFLIMLIMLGQQLTTYFWPLRIAYTDFWGLPFSLDLVVLSSFYFILGYTVKNYIYQFKPNLYLFIISFFCVYIAAYHFDASIKLFYRNIGNPFVAIPSSLFAIYCGLTISTLLSKMKYISQLFLAMGVNSLFILIFHVPVMYCIDTAFNLPNTTAKISILLLLSITFSVFLGALISKNLYLSALFKPLKNNKLFQKNTVGPSTSQ
ncbi:MAG: acyltransferase family protein [Methylophilaceae bacterium]